MVRKKKEKADLWYDGYPNLRWFCKVILRNRKIPSREFMEDHLATLEGELEYWQKIQEAHDLMVKDLVALMDSVPKDVKENIEFLLMRNESKIQSELKVGVDIDFTRAAIEEWNRHSNTNVKSMIPTGYAI